MKKAIKFIVFNNSVNKVKEQIPSVMLYKKHLDTEWLSLGEACLNATPAKVKKLLPLKSLIITATIGSTVFIKFDKSEFKKVMNNKINQSINELIDNYQNQKLKSKYHYYIDNKDTLELLLDAIDEEYHIKNEGDIAQVLSYLHKELNHSEANKKQDKNIKERMEIELEFIKRRNEAQNLDF